MNDVAGFQRNVVSGFVFLLRISSDHLEERYLSAVRIAEANVCERALRTFRVLVFFDAGAGRKAGAHQRRAGADRATIDATHLNRRARFVVKDSVAVRVLAKVTVNAVHPFFKMDVVEMHSLPEAIRIVRRDDCIPGVEQVPFTISFEDFAKHPAMSVKVCELRALELAVEFRHAALIQKIWLRPKTAQAGRLRIAIQFLLLFSLRRIVLLRRIHLVAVGFVVPPNQAEIRRNHVLARVHVTDHALRSGYARRQLMFDRMARFISGNACVGALRHAQISGCTIKSGMLRITIVRIDHMAGRAAA